MEQAKNKKRKNTEKENACSKRKKDSGTQGQDIKHPIISYYGGKWRLAKWIISHFPEHQTYVEPFCGSAAVLFKKQSSPVEVINDIDSRLVNFFTCCRDHKYEMAFNAMFTPFAREEHARCNETKVGDKNEIEDARRFLVSLRQSVSGITYGSYSYVITHSRKNMASTNSKWLNIPEQVLQVANRLSRVQIENLDVIRCIKKYDTPNTLFYLDPPYLPETRQKSSGKVYQYEMPDHEEFLTVLNNIKGKFVLSGYSSEVYEKTLKDYKRVCVDVCPTSPPKKGRNKAKRTEVLWIKD